MSKRVPEYALQPMKDVLSYVNEAERLLQMSVRGVSGLRGMPHVIEVLAKVEGMEPDDGQPKHRFPIEEANEFAQFAQREIDSGFPLLHAHTLVGIWGAFEAGVEDMLVGILVNEPELLQDQAFGKVRVTLAEFEVLDKEDRMRVLLEEISRAQGTARKRGVDKFEMLLDRFQLSGSLDAMLKKSLWEMHHLRNVIVHRASIADRRLVVNCPWLALKVGQKVVIAHDALFRYFSAVCGYLTEIVHRLCRRYKVEPAPESDQFSPSNVELDTN